MKVQNVLAGMEATVVVTVGHICKCLEIITSKVDIVVAVVVVVIVTVYISRTI
jgi:hypothetical protein